MTGRTEDNYRPAAEHWSIPRRVWYILLSWGLAVLVVTSLLSLWVWQNQRHAEHDRARLKLQQDKAMCSIIDIFLSSPEPPAGPAGDRFREVRDKMAYYSRTLDCSTIGR